MWSASTARCTSAAKLDRVLLALVVLPFFVQHLLRSLVQKETDQTLQPSRMASQGQESETVHRSAAVRGLPVEGLNAKESLATQLHDKQPTRMEKSLQTKLQQCDTSLESQSCPVARHTWNHEVSIPQVKYRYSRSSPKLIKPCMAPVHLIYRHSQKATYIYIYAI